MNRLPNKSGTSRGFSLVELLVVIGIIAVLISILMPSLTLVRERANQVKCLATLRNLGFAGQLHVIDHAQYLPTAGWQWNCIGGSANPKGLGDEQERKYDYYHDDD